MDRDDSIMQLDFDNAEFNPENTRTPCSAGGSIGAEDGIRTRDPHLGKVMLYH
jgi:hypothetical protein